MSNNAVHLPIPTDPPSWIAIGISQEDFELMMQTIELWKHRIVKAPSDPASAANHHEALTP